MESNIQKMRTALVRASTALKVCDWPEGIDIDGVNSIIAEIESAIALPDRNCDIGTAYEQSVRMAKFCKTQYEKSDCYVHICSECELFGSESDCVLSWAQMPYIESGVS